MGTGWPQCIKKSASPDGEADFLNLPQKPELPGAVFVCAS